MSENLLNDQQIENKLCQQEIKIKELAIQNETLEREFNELLEKLNITREQLCVLMSNKDNFTPENWEELQRQQNELDQKLLLQLKNISNPLLRKKTLAEQKNINKHWLFVK